MRKEKRHFRRRVMVFVLCLLLLAGFHLPAYAEAELPADGQAETASEEPSSQDTTEQNETFLADPATLHFEVDDFIIRLDPADGVTKEYVALRQAAGEEPVKVERAEGSDEANRAIESLDQSSDGGESLTEPKAYKISLTEEGIDPSLYTFQAELTPKASLLMEADSKAKEMEEQDPEGYFILEAALSEGGVMEQPEPAYVSVDKNDIAPLQMTAAAGQVFAVGTQSSPNPTYQVSYFVNMTVPATNGEKSQTIINSDNGGTNEGGKMPVNGRDPQTKRMYFNSSGGNQYVPATTQEKTQYFRDNSFEYYKAPNLNYINKLIDNKGFKLSEVIIDKTSYKGDQINQLLFTNRDLTNVPQDKIKVRITDNTKIELIYDEQPSTAKQKATFYDYRIFNPKNGKLPTGNENDPIVTSTGGSVNSIGTAYGINSIENYSTNMTSGSNNGRFAFGNSNSGTHLGHNTWQNNYLNMYNSKGFRGCTFGLAKGLNENGTVVCSSGVYAPNLFDDGKAEGKKEFNNATLTFTQTGDTHVLTSATSSYSQTDGQISASNLNQFTHYGNYDKPSNDNFFISNNFWPLDSTKGFDIKSGNPNNKKYYKGWSWDWNKEGTYTLPVSDDGKAHNNLFGMSYEISFELTDDYIGPLNYTFFGDDDMWVFLYKDGEPQNAKPIVDIGGVHSSVGQYVNLWDYIPKETDYNNKGGFKAKAGTWKLKFYYTERGLSGSSCYMQYTLPSVSSLNPSVESGSLEIKKETINAPADMADKAYDFKVELKDQNDQVLPSDYTGKIIDANGNVVDYQLLVHDNSIISLKAGQTAIIDHLPLGTKYTVTELGIKQEDGKYPTEPAPQVYYSTNKTEYRKGKAASGTISQSTAYFYCKNVYPFEYKLSGTKQFDYASGAKPDQDYEFKFHIYECDKEGKKLDGAEDTIKTVTFEKDAPTGKQNSFEMEFKDQQVPESFIEGEYNQETVYYRIEEEIPNNIPQIVFDKGYVIATVTYKLGDDNMITTEVAYKKYDKDEQEVTNGSGNVGAIFTNQYVGDIVLPDTGSKGIPPYLIGGLLMVLTGALIITARKIKKRKM